MVVDVPDYCDWGHSRDKYCPPQTGIWTHKIPSYAAVGICIGVVAYRHYGREFERGFCCILVCMHAVVVVFV